MKKAKLSFICSILVIALLLSALTACGGNVDDKETTESETTGVAEKDTEKTEETTEEKQSDSESEFETLDNETESETEFALDGEHGKVIETANKLANGVNAYFPSSQRDNFVIENQNMSFDYSLKHSSAQLVNYIKNPEGKVYVENTMDVYVRMNNGITYYASESNVSTATNLYRMGYYMYELRLESQVFGTNIDTSDAYVLSKKDTVANGIKRKVDENGDLYCMVSNESDPNLTFSNTVFSADKYKYLQIIIKSDFTQPRNADIYLTAGGKTALNNDQVKRFVINPGDDYILYTIDLSSIKDYTGDVTKFRLDVNAKKGEIFYIKDIRVIDAGETAAPPLTLNRSVFAFSDKMHERLQICAKSETKGIEEIGMITKISADRVEKLIIKDSKATHESLEGVTWKTVEYVGFDIKDVGVFGLILPKDRSGDKLTVTLEGGEYVIIQSRTPQNNTIVPSVVGTENANDFYMGHRIYADSYHDFEAFLKAAEDERNPLGAKNFKVVAENSEENSEFVGYDPLRGVYVFNILGGGFNSSYYVYPNKHYNLRFTVSGEENDRSVYLLALTSTGNLECAVLLDNDLMMLPVPLEVGKNFKGDGEDNIFNLDDKSFSDTVFPLYIKADEKTTYTLVNLYQNWGAFPLKQLSWIQFHAPYYHLSTGVTETNCIVPWYTTRGSRSVYAFLPDHRAMSAPLWENQPQHTSGGSHALLQYTDADGKYHATENKKNTIDSYGPTYADIVMEFLSDDGKIKASYTHMEMPQVDENRGYYEIRLEVIEDVTVNDFKNDFSFYSVTDNSSKGTYKQFGYLNENNESVTTTVNTSNKAAFYVLGDKCPYFDYFDLKGSLNEELEYVNVSFLIYNSEIIIGGEQCDARFVVKEIDNTAYISLDLGKVTLKAGDSFEINAIIMPWGSQESVYDGSNGKAPDQNVRDVRQNTLLDPIVTRADADCEVIETQFMPKIRTTNGKSAEFTISGGENNVAVRVYGFDMLTAPKIYEKIDGSWVEYTVNSSKTPDNFGYYQYYDGYCVYYDGGGKYSYSFVADMSGDAVRTFKIVADEEFDVWPEVEKIEQVDPLNVYLDHNEIYESAAKAGGAHFSSTGVAYADHGVGYIRFYGNNKKDSYLSVFKNSENTPTGQYLVLKYRVPSDNPDEVNYFEVYTSTVNESISGSDGFTMKNTIIADDQWHILVVDLGARNDTTFASDANGVYTAKYLRIDVFNAYASTGTKFDISYVGFCDDINKVFDAEPTFESILFSEREDVCYDITREDINK